MPSYTEEVIESKHKEATLSGPSGPSVIVGEAETKDKTL